MTEGLLNEVIQGRDGFHIIAPLELVEATRETAASWAADHITVRSDIGWIVGRYVEADKANRNGHIFPLEHLTRRYKAVVNTPLNMLHRAHHVVGTYVAAKLLDGAGVPLAEAAAYKTAELLNPHVETVAAFWKYAFPSEYAAVQRAFKEGLAWQSMEAVPKTITCVADGQTFDYAGPQSDTYCDHLRASPRAARVLNEPHFVGGGIIIPPSRPGWANADLCDVAGVIESHQDEAEQVYAAVAAAAPHLAPSQWETVMAYIIGDVFAPEEARTFSTPERKKLAKQGKAMKDPEGAFPITDEASLKDAIQSIGRAKNQAAAKRHIIKRARALGLEKLIPDDWKTRESAADATPPGLVEAYTEHLEECGFDPDETFRADAYPYTGGTLWLVADGWGEWFFDQDTDEPDEFEWVAQKMPDVGVWAVSDEITLTGDDVQRIGWGDAAWVAVLTKLLASEVEDNDADTAAEWARVMDVIVGAASVHTITTPSQHMDVPVCKGGIVLPHHTPVTNGPWDRGLMRRRLPNDKPGTYPMAFAWYDTGAPDPDKDGLPDAKDAWKMIHHDVAADGTVGAANITGLRSNIGYLNGARNGVNIPDADRQAVYNHLAAHLRDAGLTPPPLKTTAELAAEVEAITAAGYALQNDGPGAMVCIAPHPDVAAHLAKHGTEPADKMHVTLAYLGNVTPDGSRVKLPDGVAPVKADDLTDYGDAGDMGGDDPVNDDGCLLEALLAAVAAFAHGAAPFDASVSGVGRFNIGDGNAATYASVDAPALPQLRERLVAALGAAGVPVAGNHGLSPHITLAYEPIDNEPPAVGDLPDDLSWPVNDLQVWWGDDKHVFPLNAGQVNLPS